MEERKEQVEASPAVQALVERQRMNVVAFKSGEKAKLCGWFRISPFGDEVSNEFFLAGFDGVPWERAMCGETN
jgi:hypothetical protein